MLGLKLNHVSKRGPRVLEMLLLSPTSDWDKTTGTPIASAKDTYNWLWKDLIDDNTVHDIL